MSGFGLRPKTPSGSGFGFPFPKWLDAERPWASQVAIASRLDQVETEVRTLKFDDTGLFLLAIPSDASNAQSAWSKLSLEQVDPGFCWMQQDMVCGALVHG